MLNVFTLLAVHFATVLSYALHLGLFFVYHIYSFNSLSSPCILKGPQYSCRCYPPHYKCRLLDEFTLDFTLNFIQANFCVSTQLIEHIDRSFLGRFGSA